jgi:diguanylate cyclase (GGDEF)-like protein
VPCAVLEATRALLWLHTAADARRIAEELIHALGGELVPANTRNDSVIPADIAFGSGEPVLPAAPPGSNARARLDEYLGSFLLDARQALQLSGRSERLTEDASTDALTGLPNRRMLARALGRLTDDDTVIMIDLDHFKRVNDELGHPAGDQVLLAFGSLLRATARARDAIGRYGGEEFLVILHPPIGADAFLNRLRDAWQSCRPHPVTFSAGIARSDGDPELTVRRADKALYRAKEAGRDRWVWCSVEPISNGANEPS